MLGVRSENVQWSAASGELRRVRVPLFSGGGGKGDARAPVGHTCDAGSLSLAQVKAHLSEVVGRVAAGDGDGARHAFGGAGARKIWSRWKRRWPCGRTRPRCGAWPPPRWNSPTVAGNPQRIWPARWRVDVPGEPTRHVLVIAPTARRQLTDQLPEAVAVAAYEFIVGPLLDPPHP